MMSSTSYVDTLSDLEDFGDGTKPWADFVFDLFEIKTKTPLLGSGVHVISFEMRGTHESGDVGIQVLLEPKDWTVSQRSDELLVTYGRVTLRSTGANSDRLVRLYESWWGLPPRTLPAAHSVSVEAAGINCHPGKALSEKIHLKLFFEPARQWEGEESDPAYGELFLNFDLGAKRGWLKEKDEGYRDQVVGWLTGRFDRNTL